MKRLIQKLVISFIRYGRRMRWLKEPKRSYLYNGVRLPFYKAPVYATSSGRLYSKDNEVLNSVSFRKHLDQLRSSKIFESLRNSSE